MADDIFKQRVRLQELWANDIIEMNTGPDDLADDEVEAWTWMLDKTLGSLQNESHYVFCLSYNHYLDWINWGFDNKLLSLPILQTAMDVKKRFVYPSSETRTYWPNCKSLIILDSWDHRLESMKPGERRSWELRIEMLLQSGCRKLNISFLSRH